MHVLLLGRQNDVFWSLRNVVGFFWVGEHSGVVINLLFNRIIIRLVESEQPKQFKYIASTNTQAELVE